MPTSSRPARFFAKTLRLLGGNRRPRALILLYHRVTELAADPFRLAVTPRHFEEHLEVLLNLGPPLRLADLVARLKTDEIPDRAWAITFDDGYADNLHNALPILENHRVPATFFLTSGYIGEPVEFWWDDLDRMLVDSRSLPAVLELDSGGHCHRWNPDATAAAQTSDRQVVYRAVYQLLRPLPHPQRRLLLDRLATQVGVGTAARPTHRVMTADEVARLGRNPWVDIGAHTVTHPWLISLPLAAQRTEILDSRTRLETLTGRPVAGFSYTHGSPHDYSAATVQLVRDAGYAFACSVALSARPVSAGDDCFQLPRTMVPDLDRAGFRRRLRSALRA